ncbi:MAG: MarR family winged helix-turn-helix transcriptional regulator [Beijerinckiaceae bacterium]
MALRSERAIDRPVSRRRAAESPPEPMFGLIESMFFAYRDFVRDADRILASDKFGRAHHRVLYFVSRRPGLTIAELLEILEITKQSLNRVLNDLLERSHVVTRSGETDRRRRQLYSTPRGDALIAEIAAVQSARFEKAFAELGPGAKPQAMAFLQAMTDRPDPGAPSVWAESAE